MSAMNRRQLLKTAAVAAAAAPIGPFFPGRVLGANDRVNIAVVGIRSRGGNHISGFAPIAGVKIKTLCDIDQNLFGSRIKEFESKYKYAPGTANDMRRVFDDKDIDAVSFATPNFWHALGAIWAAQAKKHVYVEKPACHNVWEGRQMLGAARKYGVLMQVGFQNRSRKNTNAAIKFMRDGKLGKVYMARGLCFKGRQNIGIYPDGPMAEGDKAPPMVGGGQAPYTASYLEKVDYDQWIGPAAKRPFNPNRFHYNWHWQWDYGNGDTGNQGPHQFDVARWGLGKDDLPVRVRSFGGLYLWTNTAQETPNTQTSILEYADGTILQFETRGLLTNREGGSGKDPKDGQSIGVIFYGSEGRLEIDSGGAWRTFMGPKGDPGPDSKNYNEEDGDALNLAGAGDSGHFANFVSALKAGKREMLTCEVEEGVRSSLLPILSNISYRLKRELKTDGKREQFLGDAEANKMLKREYRKPFVVPQLLG